MRVGIDASPLVHPTGGVGWHTYHLVKALIQEAADVEFVGYVSSRHALSDELQKWAATGRIRWVEVGTWGLRSRGRLDRLDVFHGPNFKLQTQGRCGGVVTIHDLWLERYPRYSKKLFGQRLSSFRTRRTIRRARRVIAVSQATARDLEALYGVPCEKISVVPNGVSEDWWPDAGSDPAEVAASFGLPSARFILFVGGAEPRKNHAALMDAFARWRMVGDSHCLVVVGNPHHRIGDVDATARRFGIQSRVKVLGRVSGADLRRLYSCATVFVFPSIYEGFGMPVLEAMACGAPVITADTTALPEVVGDAALLVNPRDPDALAEAMRRVIEDRELREDLRARGLARAAAFTWARAARQTLGVYREIVNRDVTCNGTASGP